MKKLVFLLVVLFPLLLLSPQTYSQSSCSECHGDKNFTGVSADGKERSLFIDENVLNKSVHSELECADCHSDAKGEPHPEKLEKVNCGMCHEDESDNYAQGIHGKLLASGNINAPTCASCHGTHDILSSGNKLSTTYPSNLPKTCGQCHKSGGIASSSGNLHVHKPVENFSEGVHGLALAEGNEQAASCNDCHESHKLLPPSDPGSPIFRMNISQTCGQCHQDIAAEYDASIHGIALANGEMDAPTCTSCHGEHAIQSPQVSTSPTNPANISEQTCSPCHGLMKLNKKYGILINPVTSYNESYHGLASEGGSKVAANCTSCHGIHDILPQSNPNSSINPANLTKTCGQCHPNATKTFAKSYIHAKPISLDDKIANIIRKIYIYLIIIVIGGMILHNFIIWLSYVRAKYRALQTEETVQRFDRHWVVQHIATFTSFILLVITGFALKFPDAAWVKVLASIGLTEAVRRIVHRISAVVLITAAIYQWLFLLFAKSWKGELWSLMPNFRDIGDFVNHMKYHLGISKTKPSFDRYSYIEKAEFWALVWGNIIMVLTGLVLWFPAFATYFFPSWIVKASETIHYYEAWLAFLAILFYHMFFAIFHPEDYPLNFTGLTGKMPKEEARERFPKWFKRIANDKQGKDNEWDFHKKDIGK
ncbi:MAG: hypothetical protein GWP06_09170 [Actinobacteria bacterium]|nr:hypothetical protein [Actinomycetota bacterium]